MFGSSGFPRGADFDYTLPDFSGLAGWIPDWGPEAGLGVPTQFSLFAIGWTGRGGITAVPFTDGALSLMAMFHGAIQP